MGRGVFAVLLGLVCVAAVEARTSASVGTAASAVEAQLSAMYQLRSHGKKHTHNLPRFAEKKTENIFVNQGTPNPSNPTGKINGGADALAQAAAATPSGTQPQPSGGAPLTPAVVVQQDPVDFPPVGMGQPPADGNKDRVFVPFGKNIPRKPQTTYYTASGNQECAICKYIISNMHYVGTAFFELCNGMWPSYMPMCHAQQKTLQGCPEFTQQWCYQDLGGSQVLRSPCPDHLICHYCLGINPMHCMNPW